MNIGIGIHHHTGKFINQYDHNSIVLAKINSDSAITAKRLQ